VLLCCDLTCDRTRETAKTGTRFSLERNPFALSTIVALREVKTPSPLVDDLPDVMSATPLVSSGGGPRPERIETPVSHDTRIEFAFTL